VEARNRIYFAIIVLLFYIGDIVTTYFGLKNGGHEANVVMASVGFNGMVIIKTIFVFMVLFIISYLEKYKQYAKELGVMIGSIIAFGLFTVLNNIGFYQ
jgi:hypothetical protein